MQPAEFTRLVEALCLTPEAQAGRAARSAFLYWALRIAPGTDARRAACGALLRLYPFVASAPALALFSAQLSTAAHLPASPPRRRRLH